MKYEIILVGLMILGGCSGLVEPGTSGGEDVTSSAPAPPTGHPGEDHSVTGAVNVVRRYYAAINTGDYRTAYDLWGESGPPDQSYEAFVEGYADTAKVGVEVTAKSRPEGAAGSIYVSVPVVVRATLNDGRKQRFEGDYVVRRVNDVPGASAAQLRWHLQGADLHSVQ